MKNILIEGLKWLALPFTALFFLFLLAWAAHVHRDV